MLLSIALGTLAVTSVAIAQDSSLTVQTEKHGTLTFARLEPSSIGFVKAYRADGTREFLAVQRIRWIKDAEGRDRTKDVLDRRESLGDKSVTVLYELARPRTPALRGSRQPDRVFPIVQFGVLARLDQDPENYRDADPVFAMELGVMKNISESYGVGGTLFVTGEDDGYYDNVAYRLGAKARVRRWLTRTIALDVAPGIIVADDSDVGGNTLGFVGELGVSFGDLISLTGQMETEQTIYYEWDTDLFRTKEKTDVSWYLGTKLGGEFAVAGFLGAMAAMALIGD